MLWSFRWSLDSSVWTRNLRENCHSSFEREPELSLNVCRYKLWLIYSEERNVDNKMKKKKNVKNQQQICLDILSPLVCAAWLSRWISFRSPPPPSLPASRLYFASGRAQTAGLIKHSPGPRACDCLCYVCFSFIEGGWWWKGVREIKWAVGDKGG